MPDSTPLLWQNDLLALAGGLFLLATFGMVATRQVQGCLWFFILQSICLCFSALLLAYRLQSWDLAVVGAADLIAKPIVMPRLLRRSLSEDAFNRREVAQMVDTPTSLLIATSLLLLGYALARPLMDVAVASYVKANLPIGFAGLLVAGCAVTLRREAVPLFLGLLAMENSVLFVGFSVAPNLPMLAEVAIILDVLAVVFVFGILTRALKERIGTTGVGLLTLLKEESSQ